MKRVTKVQANVKYFLFKKHFYKAEYFIYINFFPEHWNSLHVIYQYVFSTFKFLFSSIFFQFGEAWGKRDINYFFPILIYFENKYRTLKYFTLY